MNDLTGQRFGKLVAVEPTGRQHRHVMWRCLCDCGNVVETLACRLRSGRSKTCGCSKAISDLRRASATQEWHTPARYVEKARLAMGGIELDPASSHAANGVVRADRYHTIEDDGLAQDWVADSVFLNPPYRRGLVERFVGKLVDHANAGEVRQAILLVNAHSSTRWFQRALGAASALCLPDHRISFIGAGGRAKRSVSDSAFLYFGPDPDRFELHHRGVGPVLRP